jgi:hypothetical protein
MELKKGSKANGIRVAPSGLGAAWLLASGAYWVPGGVEKHGVEATRDGFVLITRGDVQTIK